MLWGDNFWNGYWVAGGLRYIIVLHFTWCVNSAAHLYGDHPYDPASWPAENPLVSLGALGEGWHNWHHKYPFDYAGNTCSIPSPDHELNPNLLNNNIPCYLASLY
jgi:stearoyl-CoA desaturase (delta-9 desaturase)